MHSNNTSGGELLGLIAGVGGMAAVFAVAAAVRVSSGIACYGLGATLLILLIAAFVFAAGVAAAGPACSEPGTPPERRAKTPGLDRAAKQVDRRFDSLCPRCLGAGCEWLNLPKQGGCMRHACPVCNGSGRK